MSHKEGEFSGANFSNEFISDMEDDCLAEIHVSSIWGKEEELQLQKNNIQILKSYSTSQIVKVYGSQKKIEDFCRMREEKVIFPPGTTLA